MARCWSSRVLSYLVVGPAAKLGMAGMELRHNSLGAGQRGGAQRYVWSVLHFHSSRSLPVRPCSQTMLLLPHKQSDVYSLLIVSSECC